MPHFIDPQVSEKLTIRNCDCVIVCDGHRFRAHRSVIEKHSPILAAAFNGSFKVSCPPRDLGGVSACFPLPVSNS